MKKITKIIAAFLCSALMAGCSGSTSSEAPVNSSSDIGVTSDSGNSTVTNESEPAADSTVTPETTSAASTPETTSAASTLETTSAASTPETTSAASTPETTGTAIVRDLDYEWDKVIALTFDDGPNTSTTYEVLEVLKKHGVVASFFLIGNNINEESAKAVKYAYDLGCEIDNHSKSHNYMNEMSAEECAAEIKYVDDKVFEITGEHTKFFRPPYLAIDFPMWDYIEIPFIAGIGCDDWNPKVDVDRRVAVIEKKAKDCAVILMHDAEGNSQTVEAIDRIIPDLKAQGYKFVTVSELFEAKGITPAEDILYSNVMQTGTWS